MKPRCVLVFVDALKTSKSTAVVWVAQSYMPNFAVIVNEWGKTKQQAKSGPTAIIRGKLHDEL